MGSKKTSTSFKRKLLVVAVISCFADNPALAAPTGATVKSGSATFSTSGNTLTVTNTPNAIINWASFSINTDETVRFVQQSSASAVLNRVTGSDPSHILGALQSNGKVFLINPNGIMFGAGARVDVNGLVASSLNMTDADFLEGRLRFNADVAAPGSVSNAGQITTPAGGFVYLLAPSVENSGVITTPSGEAILAAGNSVEIVDSTDPGQRVLVSATSQDVNLSQLMVQNNGNIFSVLNSGKVSANTVVQDKTGRIYFKSAGNIETNALSVVQVTGDSAADGGRIQAFAYGDGSYAGSFDASGRNGGFIETSGHTLDISGASVTARALDPAGKAGMWLLDPFDYVINAAQASSISHAIENGVDVTISTASSSWSAGVDNGAAVGSGLGDITVSNAISPSYGGANLFLLADHDIIINAGINVRSGHFAFQAGHNIDLNSGTLQATSSTTSSLTAGSNISIASGTSISAPNLSLTATSGSIAIGGSLSADELLINAADISLDNASISSSPGYGDNAIINLHATGNIAISNASSVFASGDSGDATIDLHAGGTVSVINSDVSATGFSGGHATLDISATNISISSTAGSHSVSVGAYGGGDGLLTLAGSNVTLAGASTSVTSYSDSAIAKTVINSGSLNVSGASVFVSGSTSSDLEFTGNTVTFQNGAALSADQITGTVQGNLNLDDASLHAASEMRLETGGRIALNNSSSIIVDSPNTLFFNFPLLAGGGWLVDGVANVFGTSGNGSYLQVNGTLPILGGDFFVTYGGLLNTILGPIYGTLLNSPTSPPPPPPPTSGDFFGTGVTGSTCTDISGNTIICTDTGTETGTGTDLGIGTPPGNEEPTQNEDQPRQCS